VALDKRKPRTRKHVFVPVPVEQATQGRRHRLLPRTGIDPAVEAVRHELAEKYLHGPEKHAGRLNVARNHLRRVLEEVEVVGAPVSDRHVDCVAGLAPTPPDALDKV
jgi:hypothetical protein